MGWFNTVKSPKLKKVKVRTRPQPKPARREKVMGVLKRKRK